MFDGIIPQLKFSEDVSFVDPNYLTLHHLEEEDDVVSLEKGANNYIYKYLCLKESTSKEVFKKSSDLWLQLVRLCEENSRDSKYNFYFNKPTNCYFVTDSHELIDVYDAKSDENLEFIKNKYEKFKLDITERTKTSKIYTDGENGTVKIILYSSKVDITDSEYTSVVVLEANPIKSKYMLYTGILVLPSCIFIPSLNDPIVFEHYSDLIIHFDIDYLMDRANESSESLYKDYLQFKEEPVEISARELISLLRKVGYKLQLNNDNDLGEIDAIVEEESNNKIQNFFNTFKFTTDETAVDILNLSELRKMFRYNKLTFLDILEILSSEYVKYTGAKITAEILVSIMRMLYSKTYDEQEVEVIKGEID